MRTAPHERLYEFVYRAMLTEEALDSAGRLSRNRGVLAPNEVATALSFELFDEDLLEQVRPMATVYTAIAAFEISVRRFVKKVLIDTYGEDWWDKGVSEKIRKFADVRRTDEEKVKWHGVRGDDLLSYTELGHLPQIMQQNWEHFEAYVPRVDWATSLFATLERSRNVIMHSGTLAMPDVERIGMNIRDWNKQVSL
ncbi:MAG: Swt1 family HEPN domain-containing protein [Actinomycetota bacterium]|nr:Swt1 family HEPN domain-containing protein [Actinomycetota bacterium]